MDKDTRIQRRKELRRQNRSKIRQDLFISEYIQYKYFDIYSEAAEFYNALNNNHPRKYDLRKTTEFKTWKKTITGETVNRPKRLKPSHASIQPNQIYNLEPVEVQPQAQMVVIFEEPTSPDTGEPQPSSPNPSEQPSSPDTGEPQPSSPNPSEQPSSPDTGEPQPSSPAKQIYTDNLQLRIPLLPHAPKAPTKHPTVTTETLQIVSEETLEEDTLEPSIYEELAPELLEKIIDELRSEPDLQDIFTNVEQQFEFEQLGMDIDIPVEDNALEIEVDQW